MKTLDVPLTLWMLPMALLAGCDSPVEPDPPPPPPRLEVAGRLLFKNGSPEIRLPSRVFVGEEFTLVIMTEGGGCSSQGRVSVSYPRRRHAEVRIYDYELAPTDEHSVCPSILKVFRHQARLRFEDGGTATVAIIGQNGSSQPITISRQVVVSWRPPPIKPMPEQPARLP